MFIFDFKVNIPVKLGLDRDVFFGKLEIALKPSGGLE